MQISIFMDAVKKIKIKERELISLQRSNVKVKVNKVKLKYSQQTDCEFSCLNFGFYT